MKMLLVEDEPDFSRAAMRELRRAGYAGDLVDTISDAKSAVAVYDYDIILLDRHLPDGDGLSFLKGVRRSRNDVPVILMSAEMRSIADRISGLEDGADDYIPKPLDFDELLARIRVLLRRPRKIAESVVTVGNLSFDLVARGVQIDDRPIPVARRELALLEHLVRANGRIVPREQFEQNAYGFDEAVSVNAIDVSVHRLRRTLRTNGASVQIHTVRGVGYMLRMGVADA